MDNSISWSLRQLIGDNRFPIDFARGYRLVIKGPPGVGKTTLGLHILHHHLPDNPKREEVSQGLIVYFQEHPREIDRIADQFGLSFKSHPPDMLYIVEKDIREKFNLMRKWVERRASYGIKELCILVDGLTVLRSLSRELTHEYLMDYFNYVAREGILLIILAEASFGRFEDSYEYMADAVISLSNAKESQRHRFLEIQKMRYLDHQRGRHGFEMFNESVSTNSLFRIYPRALCASDDVELRRKQEKENSSGCYHSSGIQGLDHIITGKSGCGGFRRGDILAVTVEPGTEKRAMGLSFLAPAKESPSAGSALWLSFDEVDVFRYHNIDNFENIFLSHTEEFNQVSKHGQNIESFLLPKLAYINRQNPRIHPDRLIYILMRTLRSNINTITRVVIDGLSSLEAEHSNPQQVFKYLNRTCRIIRNSNAIGLVFLDMASPFLDISNIDMSWGGVVNFIGHFKWNEKDKERKTTFSVSKSTNFDFISFPYQVQIIKEGDAVVRMLLEDGGSLRM